jgi:light-regulated signal transduction histidine kinase (bacteriophytochrome)
MKIMVVDDDPSYLEALEDVLLAAGYDVVTAGSGEKALARLPEERVDGILLDMRMPGLSGRETCQKIRATQGLHDVPILLLTALDDRRSLIEGLEAGADDYLAKNSPFEVLHARLRAQMRRRQMEEQTLRLREEMLGAQLEAAEARAAQELAETRAALVDELERKNRELEAFSYSVSHDLRAPLRTIDGFSQALAEDYGPSLDDRARDYIGRVRAGAQRMSSLIDDLLRLSRVSRAELRRRPVDLSSTARTVVAELRQADPERDVTVSIPDNLMVEADANLLRVLLENLIGNAWKFTTRVAARIEVGRGPDGAFFVRDNGAGFDMTYVDRLFAPFQRLHTEEDFPGTGIGLATARRIVDRHGGRIWADGTPGGGATISFTLPPPRRRE